MLWVSIVTTKKVVKLMKILFWYYITSNGTAHMAIEGMKIVNEYPYIHKSDAYIISDPKHFIISVNIRGTPNPIE